MSEQFGDQVGAFLDDAQRFLTNPVNLAVIGGGVLQVGMNIATALSGVLIVKRAAGDVAKDYRDAEYGLSIVITGGEAVIRRPGFAEYVVGLLKRGVPVEMSATSPATLLNHHLEPQEAERNLESTRDTLCRLYGMLKAARWRRGPLMLWHLYRLEVERQKALMEKRLSKNKSL